jgi:hypothetical protein
MLSLLTKGHLVLSPEDMMTEAKNVESIKSDAP